MHLVVIAALLAAMGWAVGRPLKAGQDPDPNRAAIQAVLTAQQIAWNKGDIPKFMDGYWNSPDLTFAGSKGFTRGWEPVLDSLSTRRMRTKRQWASWNSPNWRFGN